MENNDRYIIKYYYNNKFIGYHNSYGESRGYVYTRLYAGTDKNYIKKYNSERGARIASNSGYFSNSFELIINTDESKVVRLSFENNFVPDIKGKGYGLEGSNLHKEICKLSDVNNDKIDLSEVIEIMNRYDKYLGELNNKNESVDIYKKDQKYNIIYADKDGKDNSFEYTPEEDMTKPKMIMKCKEANDNFVKLKEIKLLKESKNMENIKTMPDAKYLIDQINWLLKKDSKTLSVPDDFDGLMHVDIPSSDKYWTYIDRLVNNVEKSKGVFYGIKETLEDLKNYLLNNKMEENKTMNEIKTIADAKNAGYDFDIGDNTIDMMVYFDYDPESGDSFDKCMKYIAENTEVIEVNDRKDYLVVDLYTFVQNHINAFEAQFEIEDKEDKAASVVEEVMEPLILGDGTDSLYTQLYSDFTANKVEESLFNKEYVVYATIKGSSGYIGNNDKKGEDNLTANVDDALKFDNKKAAELAATELEKDFNANEVSVLPYNKANKIDKKEEDHQLYYDDIQKMNTQERHNLWMQEHDKDFENDDEFWDWAEEEYPIKELNEGRILKESNTAFIDSSEILSYAEQYLNDKIGKCTLMQRDDGQTTITLYGNEDKWLDLHNQVAGLSESKHLNEGKINYLDEIKNLVETAQYNMGLDEFYNFLDQLKGYVDEKHHDNTPTDNTEPESDSSLQNKSVKQWMLEVYPDEKDFITDMYEDITFAQAWERMQKGEDIYEILDFGDSVIREDIFEGIALAFGIEYNDVYNVWLGK